MSNDDPHFNQPPDDQSDPLPRDDADASSDSAPSQVGPQGQFSQQVRHRQVAARVPEGVGRGLYANTALVLAGSHEFVVDFLQSVARPQQVVQRIVLPPTILQNLLRAIRQNIDNYQNRFGEIPKGPPTNPNAKPPSIEEIYDQLKLPEELASGQYANTVMITHGPNEFCFDFITGFYPRASVASRIYMAAPSVPRLAASLENSLKQYQARIDQMKRQQQNRDSGEINGLDNTTGDQGGDQGDKIEGGETGDQPNPNDDTK